MADILSQKEIDDLLSANISGDEEADETAAAADAPETIPTVAGGKRKYFKSEKKLNFRFPNTYKSPVIKSSRMKYNPDPTEDDIIDI